MGGNVCLILIQTWIPFWIAIEILKATFKTSDSLEIFCILLNNQMKLCNAFFYFLGGGKYLKRDAK